MTRRALGAALALALAGCFASAAGATFPGKNGKIIFVSDGGAAQGSYNQFYTANPNGTGVALLPATLTEDAYWPAYSPEGGRIAFFDNQISTFLSVIDADGSNLFYVTPFPGNGDRWPAWLPSGKKLIFTHADPDTGNTPSYLWQVNIDGSGFQQLMPPLEGIYPAVSPDGRWVAFTALDGTLSLLRRDGSGRVLTFGPGITPDWAPNSRALAFSRDGAIWTMNLDGTMQISRTSGAFDWKPVWSPAGSSIAFERYCGFEPDPACNGGNRSEIWVMHSDGRELRRITQAVYTCEGPQRGRARPDGLGGPLLARADGTCIGNGSYVPSWQPLPR